MNHIDRYILDENNNAIPESDFDKWRAYMRDTDHVLCNDVVGTDRVITWFTGFDFLACDRWLYENLPPLIFATSVNDNIVRRSESTQEAMEVHTEVVLKMRCV